MKISRLMFLMLLVLPVFGQKAVGPREQLNQYTAQLQSKPGDDALREQIIKLALSLDPKPAIPEDADRFMARGTAAIKDATTDQDFKDAVAEFEKATVAAPWLANAYYNLAVAQNKSGDYAGAQKSLKFYLLAAPNAPDAKDAKDLMYEMEYKQEKAAREQAEQARLDQEAAEKKRLEDERQARLHDVAGDWNDEKGNLVIRIVHSGAGYSADIPDNNQWKDMSFTNGTPGRTIIQLKSFSASGPRVYYTTQSWIKNRKMSFGPWTVNASLALSDDGTKLVGSFTTTTNLGTSSSNSALYRGN